MSQQVIMLMFRLAVACLRFKRLFGDLHKSTTQRVKAVYADFVVVL